MKCDHFHSIIILAMANHRGKVPSLNKSFSSNLTFQLSAAARSQLTHTCATSGSHTVVKTNRIDVCVLHRRSPYFFLFHQCDDVFSDENWNFSIWFLIPSRFVRTRGFFTSRKSFFLPNIESKNHQVFSAIESTSILCASKKRIALRFFTHIHESFRRFFFFFPVRNTRSSFPFRRKFSDRKKEFILVACWI